MTGTFDLNIENVLENWEICHAVREVIANAIDEMVITKTKPIEIFQSDDGLWHIRDFGRGLQYKHFTQNESDEKAKAQGVIGKFGVGLKDALAVFYRHKIAMQIYTPYGDITLDMVSKVGFNDVKTLNAVIKEPSRPDMNGTEFVIGVKDEDVILAKNMFLYFNEAKPLDISDFGEIYEKPLNRETAFIYVHGVKVAEEDNYLFDYNITQTNTALKKALNRERSHVGRTAYSETVKKMVLKSSNEHVIELLIKELDKFSSGTQADEARLLDVQVHAVKMYNQQKKIVVISSIDSYSMSESDKEIIRESGREVLIVPDTVFSKVSTEKDYDGTPIGTLEVAKKEYNDAFEYDFVKESSLTEQELQIWNLRGKTFEFYGNRKYRDRIRISNNINSITSGDTLGVYESSEDIIIIKRSQLKNIGSFFETLFHEIAHATSGYRDNTRDFESELGKVINALSKNIFQSSDIKNDDRKKNNSFLNRIFGR